MAAFDWLRTRVLESDDLFSRDSLKAGFVFQGVRVHLIGPQGIFKPSQISHYPLSITTTSGGPYKDAFDPSGELLHYRYRGSDPDFHENRRLRDAMRDQVPLIYFHSTVPGQYLAIFPVFVVGDDVANLTFTVAVDDFKTMGYERDDDAPELRRAYVTRQVRQRIHQRTFRARVLTAYKERCTVCNLRHSSLLDAAHITADSDELGEPIVSNGLTLCKLHHAAFDRAMFAIKPSYTIEVRRDILDESDGPMLLHGLQQIHGRDIRVPRKVADRPDRERLEVRYHAFQENQT